MARGYQLRIGLSNHEKRRATFDGFHRDDYDRLSTSIAEYYQKRLEQVEVSTRGWNWGSARIEDDEVKFLVREKLAFEIPVEQIANSNVAGKTEVSMEFINAEQQQPVANTGSTTNGSSKSRKSRGDQLVEMRFHIPGNVEKGSDEEDDEENEDAEEPETAANAFHEAIKAKVDIGQAAGDGIIMFKEVLVLTPRGRYDSTCSPVSCDCEERRMITRFYTLALQGCFYFPNQTISTSNSLLASIHPFVRVKQDILTWFFSLFETRKWMQS